uniref:ATP synthase complex subunit 8 n=1 Tax=Eretmobrycon emperador TaxID=2107540 RepID=Q71Q84_9TELE|nr:ATPase synthase subunit 8 [Eretmobrycon emperador]AAQ03290.1 ATPase synthase subunit 8 [Eretmobrycon emperador]AAQ03294.1 ATPase synthase subunit 8 [Eretmobrycon emperador]AAQ03296.1 ATPase synthase subunit 8 [Eretmobrycon emperador]AAQ03298.1 ATPase synthase subunit 8 [Eretmobrycon emperador]
MPQLNPAPWFTILVFSWLIFLVFIPPKILKHTFNNEPTTISSEMPKTNPWNWPWH